MLTRIEWKPLWHIPFDKREIEHIDYSSIEEVAIAFAPWLELCHLGIGGGVEDESIEKAVDNVACCSCRYEGEANNVAYGLATLYLVADKPRNESYGYNSEESEEEFASPQFPSKCHAVVLDKDEAEPTGYFNALAQMHACLDTDLDDLVNDKNGDKYGGR